MPLVPLAVEAGQAAGVAEESLIGQLVRLVAVMPRRWQSLAASCGTLNFDASVVWGSAQKGCCPEYNSLPLASGSTRRQTKTQGESQRAATDEREKERRLADCCSGVLRPTREQ